MEPTSALDRIRTTALAGATGVVAAGLLALAIRGSFIAQGNFICDIGKNPNCGIVSGTRAEFVPLYAPSTATGGDVHYDTILAPSVFNAAVAAAQGHRTGSGVVHPGLQLHIISNPTGAPLDCSVVGGPNSATGGTVLFANVSATGSIATYDSSIVLGPTQDIKCGTMGTPAAGFSAELRGVMNDSAVVN